MIMICFLSNFVIADETEQLAKCRADKVLYQSEIIQTEADLRFCKLSDEHYKKLYESEVFWGNVKTIAFMIALGLLASK